MAGISVGWAAGFFDGEGSIHPGANTYGTERVSVSVAQVDPAPLELLRDRCALNAASRQGIVA